MQSEVKLLNNKKGDLILNGFCVVSPRRQLSFVHRWLISAEAGNTWFSASPWGYFVYPACAIFESDIKLEHSYKFLTGIYGKLAISGAAREYRGQYE